MRLKHTLPLRLRSLFRGADADRELDEELRYHLDHQIEELVSRGMTPEHARRAALVAMGGLDQRKEQCRDMRKMHVVDDLLRDLRYAARSWRLNPGFTAAAIVSLALGIGATTAVFSVVNAVLLRPLPYADPERLVMLWTDDPAHGLTEEGVSIPNFSDWRIRSRSFVDLAIGSRQYPATLTGGPESQRVESAAVSANVFSVLGVAPLLGRAFSPDDVEHRERVVVLSHGLWQRRFGGAAAAVGQTLEIDGAPWRIIGVMPPSFQFPAPDVEFWLQLTAHRRWRNIEGERYSDFGRVIGRLKPGVTVAQAQAEMTAIGSRMAREYPAAEPDASDFAGFGVNVVPLAVQLLGRQLPLALWLLFGAVLCVLSIACANVANLLLARGSARALEIAVRRTLGAARARIVRQLLTESLLLAVAAGIVGVVFSAAGLRMLTALGSGSVPRLDGIGLDGRVLAFTVGITLLAGGFFGVAPALGLSTAGSLNRRSSHGRPGAGLRHSLVIAEVALSGILLCGTGLLLRSFARVQAVDPGFQPRQVLAMRVMAADAGPASFFTEVLERVNAIPGVESAGFIEDVLQRRNPDYRITITGRRSMAPSEAVSGDAITPGAFEALGVRLLRGRLFSERDRGGRPIAIVNDTLARHFFPGEDPIGKEFGDENPGQRPFAIVGVVSDMRRQGLERKPIAQIFWPSAQRPIDTMDLVVRTASDPIALAPAVRDAIRSVNPRAPIFNVAALDRRLDDGVAPRRFQSVLLAVFAAIALLLASVGVYSLMHYAVVQRTHEIGIRMALGARVDEIVALVFRQGMALVSIGVVLGLAGALALTRVMSGLLYDVSATDPLSFAAAAVVLAGAAALACCAPAWRAARVDPMVALRCD